MKKHLIFTLTLLIAGLLSVNAQQISICTTSSGGGFEDNGSGSMSYTIGQLVYRTAEDPTGFLTQGFQQTECTPNSAPVANAGGPYILEAGGDLQLDGSGSSDPDIECGDAIASYSWDVNNDAVFGDATGDMPLVTWATLNSLGISTAGIYTIQLTVTDESGASHTASTTLTIGDAAVPTLGQWGLINLGLLLLCAGSVVIWRREYELIPEKA